MSTHAIIQTLTDKIKEECEIVDREAAFDQSLDSEGEVNVAGLTFYPSQIWKEMDPIAYRCGVNDYADGEPWVEVDGETYDQKEVEAVIEEFKDELDLELCALEEELEELTGKNGEPGLTEEEQALMSKIADKQAEIAAVESHSLF